MIYFNWPTVQPILVLTCTLMTPVSSALPPPDSGNVTDHCDLNLPFLIKTSSKGKRPGRKFTSNNNTLPACYQRKCLPFCSKVFIRFSWLTYRLSIYWVTFPSNLYSSMIFRTFKYKNIDRIACITRSFWADIDGFQCMRWWWCFPLSFCRRRSLPPVYSAGLGRQWETPQWRTATAPPPRLP